MEYIEIPCDTCGTTLPMELVNETEQLYRCPMCGAEAYVEEDGEITYTEDEYPYDKIFDA